MSKSFLFAFRLVFSRRKESFSSFASFLAIGGLSIGVASLLLTISIVQGFQKVISEKLSSFEGEGRIQHILGKPINLDDPELIKIKKYLDKNEITPFVRGVALARSGKNADGIIIEGVNVLPKSLKEQFSGDLKDGEIIIGHILAKSLGVKKNDKLFVQLIAQKKSLSLNIPIKSLIIKNIFSSGLQEFDKTLSYTTLITAQNILNLKTNQISGLINTDKSLNKVFKALKYPFFYETWRSKHSLLFEWIKLQRWPAYIMFGLITLVGIINLMAALTMIIQEKRLQIGILLSQGINSLELKKIFMYQGGFIGLLGALIGGLFAITIIIIQKKLNFLKIPSDVYFMNEIPFAFNFYLFLFILFIIFLISVIFSWIPVRIIEKLRLSEILKYE